MKQISINSQNNCDITWDEITFAEWQDYFAGVPRSTLLQSWEYGDAMAAHNLQRVRRGLISVEGESAGLVQILEAGILGNAVHGVILDRGPLWFEGFGSENDVVAFLQKFRDMFPKRFGRRVRVIPEIENKPAHKEIMNRSGFELKSKGGYQTIWVNLRPSLEELRSNLQSSWRNKLNRGEKAGMELVWDTKGVYLPWVMNNAAQDMKARRYQGPSEKLMSALAGHFMRGEKMLIGAALVDNRPIAAIVVFIHGSCATYQLGYTSEQGRDKCAHHMLLWNALAVLKERSVHDFDLGGVNDESAKGVKEFKQGLGGQVFETVGLFT